MGIALGSNFTVNTGLPLDDRLVVADLTARDAILAGRRYEGLETYVESEGKSYRLIGGILNANWVEGGGGGAGGGAWVWASALNIADNGQITLGTAARQAIRVSGNGGPITLNADSFTTAPVLDGTEIMLVGQSDVNYVALMANAKFKIRGDWYGENGSTLTIIRDDTNDCYYESGRTLS